MNYNPLKKLVELQKQGKNVGIYSVCSANGYVIEAALKRGASAYSVIEEKQVSQDEKPW